MFRNKVFKSFDDKVVALVAAQWVEDGVSYVKLGNGWVYEQSDFELIYVEA